MILHLAWRNLFRQRRRTLLTMLTMWGGFVLSSFSIAWSDGTYNRIIEAFTRTRLGHIQIHSDGYTKRPSINRSLPNYRNLGAELARTPGVDGWSPRLLSSALVAVGAKTTAAGVMGIDPELESEATQLDRRLAEGRLPAAGLSGEAALDQGLALRLGARLGDEVVLVSQAADGSIANDAYAVVGLVDSGGGSVFENTLYLSLEDAQELFALPDAAHEIVVIAQSLRSVADLTQRLQTGMANRGLEISPWQEFAKAFYVAMEADKKGTWITLGIILLIVAISVLNTVLMNVLERTREYGVMRAIGTRPGLLFGLVVLETTMMAIIASVFGAGTAFALNSWLSETGVAFPEPITYGGMEFSRFYTEINAHSFYVPALTVLLAAVLVSALPALRAARIAPAQAIHST